MKRIWMLVVLLMFLSAAAADAEIYFMQGEQGDLGLPGLQGDKGDTGPKGDQGPQGPKGDTGIQGLKGDTGLSVAGQSVAPGGMCAAGGVKYTLNSNDVYVCNGVKGPAGDQGIKGIKGETGEKGDTGPQGPKGDTGIAGLKGDSGPIGDSVFSCTGSDCSALYNIQISNLIVSGSYTLPDCPEGYTKDARTDIVICTRGADEMVKVGDFWIDRYEAVIVDSAKYASGDCSGAGAPYGDNSYNYPSVFPRTGNWTSPLYACSISDYKPSAYMTWFQAQEACTLSGKRLCTNEEWQAAAAGTYDTTGTETGTQCHIKSTNTGARNTGLAGATPGGTDSCISKWGAEDMIGNMFEWVAMWGQGGPDSGVTNGLYQGTVGSGKSWDGFSPETSGDGDGTWNLAGATYGCDRTGSNCGVKIGLPFAALRGGDWYYGPMAGVFALILSHSPSNTTNDIGFRCCIGR